MAKKGAFGIVTFGDTPSVIGEVRSWEQTAETTEIDTTVMGSGNASMIPGAKQQAISCELFFKPEDAGQALLLAEYGSDTPQAILLQPFGVGTGLFQWSANGYVMSTTTRADADGAVEMSCTLTSDSGGGAWAAQP